MALTVDDIQRPHLNVRQLIGLNALSLPIAMANLALVTFIPTFYAVEFGLSLSLVGLIFVFGRLLDVITDPLVGYFSDRTQTHWGARVPWMVVSLPGFCAAVWLLLNPIGTVSTPYLIAVSGLYFLFYTALDVPYSSIGLEISPHVHERSTIASFKGAFQVLGAISAAFLPFVFGLGMAEGLSFTAQLVCVLSLLACLLFFWQMPRARLVHKASPAQAGLRTRLNFVAQQKPFKRLVALFLIIQTANALTVGLTVLFVTHIIGDADLGGPLFGVSLLASALCLPLWVHLSKRYGKRRIWGVSMLICCGVLACTPFLGAGDIVPAIIMSVCLGAAFGCDAIMPTSMLADIVGSDETAGRPSMAAFYLAIKNSVSKLTFIAPMGLAFPLLDFVGFVADGQNDQKILFLLVFLYAILPIAIRLVAFTGLRYLPDTENIT